MVRVVVPHSVFTNSGGRKVLWKRRMLVYPYTTIPAARRAYLRKVVFLGASIQWVPPLRGRIVHWMHVVSHTRLMPHLVT